MGDLGPCVTPPARRDLEFKVELVLGKISDPNRITKPNSIPKNSIETENILIKYPIES